MFLKSFASLAFLLYQSFQRRKYPVLSALVIEWGVVVSSVVGLAMMLNMHPRIYLKVILIGPGAADVL